MTEPRDITAHDIERGLERGRQERSRAICAGLAMARQRLRALFSTGPGPETLPC